MKWIAVALLSCVGAAHAHAQVQSVATGADAGVQQRLREELRGVMTELVETGAFGGQSPQQIALAVDAPAQRVGNLGVLVDSTRDSRDGLRVVAVTPGGSADRMGLRSGDLLVALNGVSLARPQGAAATLRATVDGLSDGSPLAFDVRREGRSLPVSGTLSSVYLPAMHLTVGDGTTLASNGGMAAAATARDDGPGRATVGEGCGRISDFDVAPRQQQLHGAKIISIDGVSPGPNGSKSFRVSAGPHKVKVAERIENRYLSFNDRQRTAGLSSDRYKTLTVDVRPDTTTLIAARLNEDQRDVWQNGAYWDPVAWKQTPESCQ